VTASGSYTPRIERFRESLIKELPRVPNDRASLDFMRALSTHDLILSLVTWRMRLIPKKPRAVKFWSGGVTPMQSRLARAKLEPLLNDVRAGRDLEPYLSESVKRAGIDLARARPAGRRRDMDMVLTRHGLHHFHVGVKTTGNPKGRSGALVFAEVLPDEFRVVAISDHRAFEHESEERKRFFCICMAYMAKDILPGEGFMPNPVMSSGHSVLVWAFARKCCDEIQRLDPSLDDPAFIDGLYGQLKLVNGVPPIARPASPNMAWYFNDLTFGILDKATMAFFCLFPYFQK
jgi:hypothetical protein